MKIVFQNPTQGPLITISFDESDAALAFVPAAVDCAAKAASGTGAVASSGIAATAGPLAVLASILSGDSSPPTPVITPDYLRCLSDPYDMSAACALTRSILTRMPFQKNHTEDPNAARASASDAGAHTQPAAGIDLATPITTTDAQGTLPTPNSVAAILRQQPPVLPRRPFQPGNVYDLVEIAAGQLRYPRLEALVDYLVAGRAHPMIVERGSGRHGALAVTVARKYPITIIEKTRVMPHLGGIPEAVRKNITLVDHMRAPQIPWADLVIWIHPVPSMMTNDDVLDLDMMGQDVAPGGYLVIQTESTQYFIPETPEWKVLFSDTTMGFLAPSDFANWTGQNMGRTIVLQRQNTLPTISAEDARYLNDIFEGDTSHHLPVIDQPPVGKTIPTWLAEMVASAGGTTASESPTSKSIAAILEKNPSQTRTAEGMTYPRLETLVAHLVGTNPSAHIVERGPGEYIGLARRLAIQHRVTLVDDRIVLRYLQEAALIHLPAQVLANIELVGMRSGIPLNADLCFWIHPYPSVLLVTDNERSNEPRQFHLNLPVLGQDVVPGGYLVIQTELLFDRGIPTVDPGWELIYEGTHMGFLAPSHFTNSNVGRTIVLRRL